MSWQTETNNLRLDRTLLDVFKETLARDHSGSSEGAVLVDTRTNETIGVFLVTTDKPAMTLLVHLMELLLKKAEEAPCEQETNKGDVECLVN